MTDWKRTAEQALGTDSVYDALSAAHAWLVRQAESDAPPRRWRAREELIQQLEAALEARDA